MLEFVDQLTRRPAGMTRGHVERLREVGFDDRAILQITMVTSYFNYFKPGGGRPGRGGGREARPADW